MSVTTYKVRVNTSVDNDFYEEVKRNKVPWNVLLVLGWRAWLQKQDTGRSYEEVISAMQTRLTELHTTLTEMKEVKQ